MPLRLEIKKLLAARSERVKSCDLHPDEPWVLSALYNGHMFIWNYNTQTVVKSFEASDQPIRCARFITRKQWIICGADDFLIRVFNINTLEKVREFEGHIDYIRYIDVHPTQPYVITSSDDMQIKLWDWEKNWANTQVFEGHAHYVMQVKFNPKDSNTFASASLDKSVKVWSLGSPLPNYSLEGHERGVNCIDYYLGGDKPYLVSAADDQMIKIWDYQTRSCVQTLDGHTSNVSSVCFHPKLPIILSGSEDGTVRMWHSTTYRLETTLNYGLERCWTLSVTPSSNKVAIGYDEGTIVITLGQEMPVVSLDTAGKLLMANNNDIVAASLRGIGSSNIQDGERVELNTKDIGSCEIFPQKVIHNSNGRFVAVCGDGEYIIYTSQALRNKSFGSGLDFAWSSEGTGDYAVRESSSRIRTFKNFKETNILKPPFSAEGLFGGHLIAVTGNEFVVFYDWQECRLVLRIDVAPTSIFWSQDGEHVVLACEDSYFVLKCDLDVIAEAFANGTNNSEDGIEGSFELLHEIGEKVESGQWVGGCFLYTNSSGRLNYCVGGEVMTLCHLDRQMFLMGFVARENRVFLIDKNRIVVSYVLLESVLQYQTAVVRRDFELANEILATIPKEKYNDISRFLESQGFKDVAYEVAFDPDQKFELALDLERLDNALEIMQTQIVPQGLSDDVETQGRWKRLGDLALAGGNLALAEECAVNACDYSGLLLMFSACGDIEGLNKLMRLSEDAGRTNIAFLCALLLKDTSRCIAILHKASRNAEAAFFAKTFAPDQISSCVETWKKDLTKVNPRAAQALADPAEQPELFPDQMQAVEVEKIVHGMIAGKTCPAYDYPQVVANSEAVLVDILKEYGPDAVKSMFACYGGTGGAAAAAAAAQQQQQQQQQMLQQQEQAEQQRIQQEAEEAERQRIQAAEEQAHQAQLLAQQQEAEQQHQAQLLAEQQAAEQQRQAEEAKKQQAMETERLRLQQQQAAEQIRQQEAQARAEQERHAQQQEAERLRQQQEAAAAAATQQVKDEDDDLDELDKELDNDDAFGDDDDLGDDLDEEFEDWS
mmetsp:Transcript_24398/g.39600  ORF Transcript_24398/g.39600 Transcript_24398/m.39600 type:complete len:1055 (+) Transcript_24398:341-3505(+)